jgi:microcystin-dependent protein
MRSTRLGSAVLAIAATLGVAQQAQAQSQPYIGQIMCAGFNFAPRGWASMDGQLLSIAQNSALFALLGTTYGGNGQTTFALPDMRGRVMVHTGMGPGLSFRNLGEQGGTENTTLNSANMPPHSHSVAPLASSGDANSISPTGKAPATKARTTLYADATPGNTMAATQSSVAGGGQPFNNMQPFVTVNCFIALEGIFPSRP